MIASGEHPVPIDLETILQPSADEHKIREPEGEAFNAAMDIIANSVMTVGFLPAYGRSVNNGVFAMGGMTADWDSTISLTWNDMNSDAMRPAKPKDARQPIPICRMSAAATPNSATISRASSPALPTMPDFCGITPGTPSGMLFDGFAGVPVRKVVRPTRFYYMLLQRLKDHRSMDDGAIWSAQADFVARLADWENISDPLWPLHRAERSALLV